MRKKVFLTLSSSLLIVFFVSYVSIFILFQDSLRNEIEKQQRTIISSNYNVFQNYMNSFDMIPFQLVNNEEVGNLFLTLLGVRIPDYKLLKKGYKKRDDIAHRYNFDKGGDIVKISINDLQELVREMNKFVYEVFNSVIKAVYWQILNISILKHFH